jgi:hypothetical protein
MSVPLRFLFTTFEGGGHVPAPMRVAARLQSLGHEVLLVSDEANRPAAGAKGLPFVSWRRAPNRTQLGESETGLDDWKSRWPPEVVRRLCAAVITGPALAYARDTLEIAATFRPDVIVTNELLLGVMAAAEARGTPLAILTANVWCYPTRPDVPPFGPGFQKDDGPVGRWRDVNTRKLVKGWYDAGLEPLNAARAALELGPLDHVLDQLDIADEVLLGVSQAFDYGSDPPPPFVHVGPLIETPEWAAPAPALPKGDRPRVLVSFGTTYQKQKPVIARCIRALSQLPVEGIVTLGPAVEPEGLPGPANVSVVQSASHDEIVPGCAAVVCHGGHGTLLRPLMHGVPVLCLPMGRDHPENAARLTQLGAGLRLDARSSPAAIGRAVARLVKETGFRHASAELGARMRAELSGDLQAARLLSAVASERPALQRAA